MYKTFIETLDKAGIQLPSWVFIVVAALIAVAFVVIVFTKFITPAILKVTDMYTDICSIKELKDVQMKAIQKSIETDQKIENELFSFMEEMRDEIKTFTEHRVNDRAHCSMTQDKWTQIISTLTEGQDARDKQIEALMCGTKELLGNAIDERYARYISLGGIPEHEVDEFDDIYEAYRGLNGNHGRETKYNYVKGHLQVIPVETKLVIKGD